MALKLLQLRRRKSIICEEADEIMQWWKSNYWNSSTNTGDAGVAMASLDTCLLRAAFVMNTLSL